MHLSKTPASPLFVQRRRPRATQVRRALLLLCSLFLLSCQTSDDAVAAAKQLATTSTDLAAYYGALSRMVTDDIALGGLQNTLLPHGTVLPFPESNRTILNTTASELQKRANLARSLQEVSTAFSSLTGSKAATDVSNAASKLGTELTNIGALPQASGSPISLPSAIGDAAKLIMSLVQQHQERKIAPALDATVAALKQLFSKENGAYDSLNQTYLTKARSLAEFSIERNLVDESSVLAPALEPFNLRARMIPTPGALSLDAAAKAQVEATNTALIEAHKKASAAMLQAITDMGTRIHQLANEGRMPSRGTPVTLTTVENWINIAHTATK